MAYIQLTQGKQVLIDDQVALAASKFRWYYNVVKRNGHGYAATSARKDNGKRTLLYLHRFVYELCKGPILTGLVVDHINNDTLDCRLENLRLVSTRENLQNLRRRRSGACSTEYVGVTRNGRGFRAQAMLDGKRQHLGTFETAEEAHATYCVAVRCNGGHVLSEYDKTATTVS